MRVGIVDDDAIVCMSLATILGAQDDIEVAGTANDGDGAMALFFAERPDVMLMDIQMPGRDGLSAADEILACDPAAKVVFLTTFSDDEYIVRALRLGARGYLIKQDVASIAPALRAVMNGQSVLEGEVLAKMPVAVSQLSESPHASEPPKSEASSQDELRERIREKSFPMLTDREFEVVCLVAEGMDNREISQAAYMSEGTVRNHISTILSKLSLKNRTQIAVAYYRATR